MINLRSLLLASVALLLPATAARAATFTVTTSFPFGQGSLPSAIIAANNAPGADTIVFSLGIGGAIDAGLPVLRDDITIVGPGARIMAINGHNQVPIFRVASGVTARISGLELTGGRATSSTGMTAESGSGGAIFVNSGATLIADQLFFEGNTAFGGGAIENFGTLQVSNSTFARNEATLGTGGAIHSTANSSALTLQNCTFANNRAADSGGAVRSDISNTTLDSLTIVGNIADSDFNMTGRGGGISLGTGASATLRNSIVAGNRRGPVPSELEGNLSVDAADIIGGSARDAGLQTDPNTGAPALNQTGLAPPTIGLTINSRAIDAGNTALATDQRGSRRPIDIPFVPNANNGSDIGAVEFDFPQTNIRPDGSNFLVNTLDDHDDGTCGVSDCTLREAINAVGQIPGRGVVVGFAPDLSGTLALKTYLPDINKNITIRGLGANVLTVDGSAINDKIFNVLSGTVALSGLTLRGGHANGVPILPNGGAIFNGGTLTLTEMVLTGNRADSNGGAILNLGGTLTINRCTIKGNTAAQSGGAIENRSGSVQITNSTISGNSASGGAGGAILNNGTLGISSCTITGNSAAQGGSGGIANAGSARADNSIIAANGSVDIAGGGTTSGGYNLIGAGGSFNGAGDQTGVTAAQLNLGELTDNGGAVPTIALGADSVAINAGDPAYNGAPFDARGDGFPRIVGGRVDVGAFESEFVSATTNNPPTLGNGILSASLNRAFSYPLVGQDADSDPLTYAQSGGTLPDGVTLGTDGVLSGTPTQSGVFSFTVTVSDGRGGAATASFNLTVSNKTDGVAPVLTRSDVPMTLTRDQLAAITLSGTVRDIAPDGVTPSGVNRVQVQLRRNSDGFAYNGRAFAKSLSPYYVATLGAGGAGDARTYTRSLSFVPSASVLNPGEYSLIVIALDKAGNYSGDVIPFTIVAPSNSAPSAMRVTPNGSGGNS